MSRGFFIIEKDEKEGIINFSGEEVVPTTYDNIDGFSDGLSRVKQDGKYGFIDRKGTIIIPINLIYDDVDDFSNGLCRVKKDDRYGFINKIGKLIVPVFHDKASAINEKLCLVKKDGKWGMIDKIGFTSYPSLPF